MSANKTHIAANDIKGRQVATGNVAKLPVTTQVERYNLVTKLTLCLMQQIIIVITDWNMYTISKK